MKKSFALTCLLLAWLCANGALLDLVQVIAWGRMFTGYARTMPVAAALRETFDASKPCELCLGVATAKTDLGRKAPPPLAQRDSRPLLLACETPAEWMSVIARETWPPALPERGPARVDAVPVPPPRA